MLNHGSSFITVGMAAYNGAVYIREAIYSIQRQSIRDWKLVVVDDGSTDGTQEVLDSIKDERIIVITNRHNLGLPKVRNQILDEVEGDFVAWLDQDDLAHPRRLEKQLAFMGSNPFVGACGSWTVSFQSSGLRKRRLHAKPIRHEDLLIQFPFASPFVFSSVMMNMNWVRNLGLRFNEKAGNALDYQLWGEMSAKTRLANLPYVLCFYRNHDGQTSKQLAPQKQIRDASLDVVQDWLQRVCDFKWSAAERATHARLRWSVGEIDLSELASLVEWLQQLRRILEKIPSANSRTVDAEFARYVGRILRSVGPEVLRGTELGEIWRNSLRGLGLPSAVFLTVSIDHLLQMLGATFLLRLRAQIFSRSS